MAKAILQYVVCKRFNLIDALAMVFLIMNFNTNWVLAAVVWFILIVLSGVLQVIAEQL
jgi:hypothetical protein